MTKEERIESDKNLEYLYSILFDAMADATKILEEIRRELDKNIQGECGEKRMANKLREDLLTSTEWANIMQKAWKRSAEIDQEQ